MASPRADCNRSGVEFVLIIWAGLRGLVLVGFSDLSGIGFGDFPLT
jgi:hypothetical protein